MLFWQITHRLRPHLQSLYLKLSHPPVPNMDGDRDIEFSWIAGHMGNGPGYALDFGCGNTWMGLLAARKGFDVTAIDLGKVGWRYNHPNLKFTQGDLSDLNMAKDSLDLIINCSSIEHVGLQGRYGIKKANEDGDLIMMSLLLDLLKPGKQMILTIPVGRDKVFLPRHRVYGPKRLPELLKGWEIVEREFAAKRQNNIWTVVEEKTALNIDALNHYYSLGLFLLRKPDVT